MLILTTGDKPRIFYLSSMQATLNDACFRIAVCVFIYFHFCSAVKKELIVFTA